MQWPCPAAASSWCHRIPPTSEIKQGHYKVWPDDATVYKKLKSEEALIILNQTPARVVGTITTLPSRSLDSSTCSCSCRPNFWQPGCLRALRPQGEVWMVPRILARRRGGAAGTSHVSAHTLIGARLFMSPPRRALSNLTNKLFCSGAANYVPTRRDMHLTS